jgi:hypothetical protein
MAWKRIQRRHPDLPDVAIEIRDFPRIDGGTHAAFTTKPVPTVMVAEWLTDQNRSAYLLECLLHEAAHALAYARGINDGSQTKRWLGDRWSDYHTKAFGTLAEELGLHVDDFDIEPFGRGRGYACTYLRGDTFAEYVDALGLLQDASADWLRTDGGE